VARELQPLLNALDAQVTRVLGVVHPRGAAFEDGFGSTQAWALSELFAPAGRWRDGTLRHPVRPETARRLACDATIIPMVLGVASEPLDVGRATRWPPPALRHAVINGDGRCRFPGCDRPPQWTDLHHLRPWAQGGGTSVHNLILLCRHHHTLVHEGRWRIHLDHDSGDVTVRYPDGLPYDLVSRPRAQSP
jgi:hypothetical protein